MSTSLNEDQEWFWEPQYWDQIIVHRPDARGLELVHNRAGDVELSLEYGYGTTANVCGARDIAAFVLCIALPGHDGPHLPCSFDEWERSHPVVTAWRSMNPPCDCDSYR